MRSIRKYLLIYLFITIATTATTISVCNYFINQKNIQKHQELIQDFANISHFELSKNIAIDELSILILTFTLAGIFIWIIVGKSLKSIDAVAKQISNRNANNYEPLSNSNSPKEIKPLIDELNMLLNRLKSGFEHEARFAADAAHELKTPLAAIKAQAQVALNSNTLEEKNLALNKVISAVDRSTRIVQQLLILSKLSPEANYNSKWDAINLNLMCKDVLSLLAPMAVENNVDLELTCAKQIPLFSGNYISLSILLKNLVENSINYCGNHGKVYVRTFEQNDDIVLEVEDDGPGIPEELQTRVFERFFRALGNKKSGSGLGLAIVAEIAKLHNAQVKLKSPETGTGLIISIYFKKISI